MSSGAPRTAIDDLLFGMQPMACDMKTVSSRSPLSLGLVAMGRIGEVAMRAVAANIQAIFTIEVDTCPPLAIPQHAYQDHRQQYDAALILKHLTQLSLPPYGRLLALTTVDLCIPIFTFVYGEAEVGGKVAVVSAFRLRRNEDGSPASMERYYERLVKVALHEVAHTFSVYHCEDTGCLMHFSSTLSDLDKVKIMLCDRCEFVMQKSLQHRRR
jgi:archaemetzincin